jgi:putative membrane protein insertion efficiency factor
MTKAFRFDTFRRLPRLLGRTLILGYRVTLSPLIGFHCRHLPTCSAYGDEALERFGLWAGGWMTLARLCRCHPFGTRGLDFVPHALPANAHWCMPWRYGCWRRVNAEPPERPLLGDSSDASDQRTSCASGSSRREASADPRSAAR